MDNASEFFIQFRSLQCKLPILLMDVQHATLCSGRRRGFRFVNRDRDTVYVQNTRKNQTAEASSKQS